MNPDPLTIFPDEDEPAPDRRPLLVAALLVLVIVVLARR